MGPLSGIKVVEFAGIGPGPFGAMVLADMGAEVVRLDRPDGAPMDRRDAVLRGRRSVTLDLKQPAAVEAALRLCDGADALIEGFRPGVMERLGLGPAVVLGRNPRLAYGRMTGWGQFGPLAQAAGHDMNYIALTGALHAMGRPGERPAPPLNLVGDYGGGGMLLALGLLAAILSARSTGRGQVVDAAMTDGAALLMAPIYAMLGRGRWQAQRESNMLDGAAPWYDTYTCADGGFLSVGPIEPQFFALFLEKLGLDPAAHQDRMKPAAWPALKEELAAIFRTRPRDHWAALFEGSDACVAPVLSPLEAPAYPHNAARETFVTRDGVVQPAPAPRFSATPGAIQGPPPKIGAHNDEALTDWGFTAAEVAALKEKGAL
jgi:alpha-methylacyl-CoA racemase